MTEIVKEHNGHTIKIADDGGMRFHVTGPLINGWYGAFAEAEVAIDETTRKHEAQNRKRIAIKVLDENGEDATVTGIHASNGSFLGLPSKGYHGAEFYPRVPWIAEALKRQKALKAAANVLNTKLRPFCVSRYSFDRIPGEDHGDKVDRLVRHIEALTAKAEQLQSDHPDTKVA